MHRHSYIGKKLSRTAGPRKALMRGLVDALILYERVETTDVKAKELARNFDKLVTKAKKQDLHNYRQILSTTINPVAAEKLYNELVNGFKGRSSGYCRLIKTGQRLGDGANMGVMARKQSSQSPKQTKQRNLRPRRPLKKPSSQKPPRQPKELSSEDFCSQENRY